MRQALTALLCALFASSAIAQLGQPITLDIQPSHTIAPAWSAPGPRPSHAVHAVVDSVALRATLAEAPLLRPGIPLHTYALAVDLPHPSGVLVPCFVAEASIFHPDLAAKFPQMRTYVVQSADSAASGRIELTQRGLSAMLREPADLGSVGGTWMIDRWQSGDPSQVIAYWLRDLPNSTDWVCTALETPDSVSGEQQPASVSERPVTQTRIARLAVACTGEYGAHHSILEGNPPNAADPLAAIVTVVSRSNVVFEADLGVTFQLVADNDQIIHFDAPTDPYPDTCDGSGGANCSSPILSVNRTYVRDTIGSANFDVGHCLTRIAGGVAYLRSVCGSNKAGGISGIPRGGDIDPLTALVVIHELGHQFGANHTFSGTRGRCESNVRLSTAWEAGSGSSPMAYAGGCPVGSTPPSDNIVQFADPFFHHGSILEMQTFLGTGTASCLTPSPSANSDPVIQSLTPDLAIPPGTPFVLTVDAFDPNSDFLTYSWEQSDTGFARPLTGAGSEDNGIGSLFRIFPPVSSPSRTFPQWSDIVEATTTPGEQLPTVTGVYRTFRVLVLDNAPGAGGTAVSPIVTLEIANGASPFAVVSPAENDTLGVGPAQISWSVGGTDLPPISVESVRIRLSEDDAFTFPHDLGSFPNSGSATISFPMLDTASARILIESEGNVFFALSRPFTISSCSADIADDFGTLGADGMVSFGDFLALLGLVGPCPGGTPGCAGDIADDFGTLGGDSQVSFGDFLALLGLVGPCP